MTRLIQYYQLQQGGSIAVEVDAESGDEERIANVRGEVVEETGKQFGDALKSVQQAAAEVLTGFAKSLSTDELELKFGLKFSAKAGLVFASADAEATMMLRALWKTASKS